MLEMDQGTIDSILGVIQDHFADPGFFLKDSSSSRGHYVQVIAVKMQCP